MKTYNDTVQFSTFVRALQMTSHLTLRRPQHGDPEEAILFEAFLCPEGFFHEQGIVNRSQNSISICTASHSPRRLRLCLRLPEKP